MAACAVAGQVMTRVRIKRESCEARGGGKSLVICEKRGRSERQHTHYTREGPLEHLEVVARDDAELAVWPVGLPPLARRVDNLEDVALVERDLSRVVLACLIRVQRLGALQTSTQLAPAPA